MTNILLVEDDPGIVANLTEFLKREGFSITAASGQTKAMELLMEDNPPFDLLLLDVSLSDGNGFSICAAVKAKMSIPVIFLTASGDEYSVVTGLDLGADDYIPKPFRPRELISRINWLIESMLKMAKMDAGTAYLKPEIIPVEQLLAKALEPLLIPLELRGVNLVQSCEKVEILCDLSWTTEAVLNILKNCMEHTPSDGEIHITTISTALYTQITIEDTGSGFDKEDLPHLFERFYKGKDASSQSVGIGLALSRMIFGAQNATVKAENSPDGGARFLIRFYREQAV